MMKVIDHHIDQIRDLCSANKVRSLFVFGSAVNNSLRLDSDIDFIVDIDETNPLSYSDHYFNLKFQLEQLLKRPIDLLENRALNNRFLKEQIERTKILIYADGD
jgi:hypothetical protein